MNEKTVGYYLSAVRPLQKEQSVFTNSVMDKIYQNTNLSHNFPKFNVERKHGFKRLPAVAVVAIIVGVVVLLSGSVYAAYELLWQKPAVHVTSQTTSQSGRDEVAISFTSCSNQDVARHYELKKNATITAAEIPMVVQAHCELDAIQSWADATFPNSTTDGSKPSDHSGKPYDQTRVMANMVTAMKSKDDSNITFVGLAKYGQQDTTFATSSKVRYIVNGREAKAADVKVDDTVTYVTSSTTHFTPGANCTAISCSYSGTGNEQTLVAVVKVDMSAQYYDQFAWQSLTEITTCMGNPNDTCLTGYAGSIDLYGPGANQNESGGAPKEIEGLITALSGATVTIKSSSGSLFTITAPTDVFTAYNSNKAKQYYNSQFVAVGKSLEVVYNEPSGQQSKTIKPAQLEHIALMIEVLSKGDAVKAY